MNGIRFRRQHPVRNFIVDFYCHSAYLVIEIDGSIHREEEQAERDVNRTYDLESLGLHVIRFTNEEVISDIDNVLKTIENKL